MSAAIFVANFFRGPDMRPNARRPGRQSGLDTENRKLGSNPLPVKPTGSFKPASDCLVIPSVNRESATKGGSGNNESEGALCLLRLRQHPHSLPSCSRETG